MDIGPSRREEVEYLLWQLSHQFSKFHANLLPQCIRSWGDGASCRKCKDVGLRTAKNQCTECNQGPALNAEREMRLNKKRRDLLSYDSVSVGKSMPQFSFDAMRWPLGHWGKEHVMTAYSHAWHESESAWVFSWKLPISNLTRPSRLSLVSLQLFCRIFVDRWSEVRKDFVYHRPWQRMQRVQGSKGKLCQGRVKWVGIKSYVRIEVGREAW